MSNMKTSSITVGALAVIALFIGLFMGSLFRSEKALASVQYGNDYNATTTAATAVYGSRTGDVLLKTGYGSLGSVVITGANTGAINLWDGTTTAAGHTQRLLATIPASTAAGTYTIDAVYSIGLLVDLVAGNMPTTTITYR